MLIAGGLLVIALDRFWMQPIIKRSEARVSKRRILLLKK